MTTIDPTKKQTLVDNANAQNTLNLKKQVSDMKQMQMDRERRDQEHLRDEKRQASNRKKGMTTDQGREISYMDLAKSRFEAFKKPSGQQAFIEWQTTMMEIFEAYYVLSKGMYYEEVLPTLASDLYDNTVKLAWKKTVGNTMVGQALEGSLYSVKETPRMLGRMALSAFKDGPKPDRIDYDVTIAEDGKLTTKLQMDGLDITPETAPGVNVLFDTGLIAWLESKHNCTFNQDTQKVTEANGEVLTAKRLQELNTDDDNGLNYFFSSRENMEIESSVSSSPRP